MPMEALGDSLTPLGFSLSHWMSMELHSALEGSMGHLYEGSRAPIGRGEISLVCFAYALVLLLVCRVLSCGSMLEVWILLMVWDISRVWILRMLWSVVVCL